MNNRRINELFGAVVVVFIVAFIMMIRNLDVQRINDFKVYTTTVNSIVKGKNSVIMALSKRLAVKNRENEDLKNTLSDTRNDLESISKKLTEPVPVAASVSVPASVVVVK